MNRGGEGDWTRRSSRNFRANGFFDNGNSKLSALAFSINGRKDERNVESSGRDVFCEYLLYSRVIIKRAVTDIYNGARHSALRGINRVALMLIRAETSATSMAYSWLFLAGNER